jgi:methionine synthase II (cobalamin-independent)
MPKLLQPAGRAMLIGSQPLADHAAAMDLVFAHVPEIPNWVQLPRFKHEGMVAQCVEGLPGLVETAERAYVDTASAGFDDAMVAFFEQYLAVTGQSQAWDQSRFVLTPGRATGFFTLLDRLAGQAVKPFALKGQITGPITFCTALTDQERRALFYNDTLRDAAVKLLALKAAWQVRQLRRFGAPVILFIDEPALAGYGSSEWISISKADITHCLDEVIEAVHAQGGLTGVHVCANTDWSLLLRPGVDIVNFDAFGYFDKVALYAQAMNGYLNAGGCLAWGLVPTLQADQVAAAELESLWDLWQGQLQRLKALGLNLDVVRRQAFITPSCGTGSLPPELSLKVLTLTQALSRRARDF